MISSHLPDTSEPYSLPPALSRINSFPLLREMALSSPQCDVASFSELGIVQVAKQVFALFQKAASDITGAELQLRHDLSLATFNLAHYPANSTFEFGISDHTDWELFTLLYPSLFNNTQNGTALVRTGLEVFFDGAWLSVPHVPGSIIVNQGDPST